MTSAQAAPALITGDQLVEMMGLIRDADSVELKLTIPEGAQRSAIKALRMDPLEAQIRQVFFFDTPDLALQSAGVVVRARRVQRR
jgi:inorganic triphosphatase YgiF